MEKKTTLKEYFVAMAKALKGEEVEFSVDELVEVIEGRIAQLDKKSATKKPSKEQEANEVIKATIMDALTSEPVTVAELMGVETLSGYSNQKLSALLRLLVEDGKVEKTVKDKKNAYKVA